VGEPPWQPRLVSRQSQTLGWPGRSKIPGPDGGASPSTLFSAPALGALSSAKGAGRHALRTRRGEGAEGSGGGSFELLGGKALRRSLPA